MNETDIHKLTGAYAMDALDDLERARFEQHLATCEDCRAEVAELRETAALLSETVAVPPPASLRDSVLAGISQVRPLAPEVIASPSRHADRPAARGRGWVPFLVAAALALIAGVGALVTQPWAPSDDVERLTAAEQVLQAPDAQEVSVDLGEAGRATITRSKSEDRAVITTEDMVSAPSGKDYELWFIDGDEFVSAGLMPDSPDQTAATVAGCTGVALGLLDEWLSGREPAAPAQLAAHTRLPDGHWTGEHAATDVLALAAKGRAFRNLHTLTVRQGGHHLLHGSALALTAATLAWARQSGTELAELTAAMIR